MSDKKQCEICHDFTFLDEHHIHSLSLGGEKKPSNETRICPTCHREVHRGLIIIEGRFETTRGNTVVWHAKGEKSVTGMKPPPVFLYKESDREDSDMELDDQKENTEVSDVSWYDPCAGVEAQNLFVETMLFHKYWVRKASAVDDMNKHIDYWIKESKDSFEVPVDVKSRKRIHRNGDIQDEWLWIEFLNGAGGKGWIDGEAEFIVFERPRDFIFTLRSQLRDLAYQVVDFDAKVTNPTDAQYKIYTREKYKRKDSISLIAAELVLKNVNHVFFNKPNKE